MKKILLIALCLINIVVLSACKSSVTVAEDPFTLSNWQQAMKLRNEQRYELAYHYYSIALSSATSENALVQIRKEMEDLERVLRAIR